MLKRLRIKFIAVIMSIVTVLFIFIFGLVLHFTKQNIERESIQMMRTMAFRPPAAELMNKPDNSPLRHKFLHFALPNLMAQLRVWWLLAFQQNSRFLFAILDWVREWKTCSHLTVRIL